MAYSSKYYDPVKAHEYYMKHRQLKSRTSTAGLNDNGKAAARQVKEALKQEKKEYMEKVKAVLDKNIARVRELMAQKREEIKREKERIKKLPKAQRDAAMKKLNDEKAKFIDRCKADIASMRESSAKYKQEVKKYFDEKYKQELDSIKADKTLQSQKKGKKKGKDKGKK